MSGVKDERQSESLVVSVPLSSATVPGINLPSTNSSNNNSSISNHTTIMTTNQQSPTMPASVVPTSTTLPHTGTLYQHLTTNSNSTGNNHRSSPLVQQQTTNLHGVGRQSPHTPTPGLGTNDHGSQSNHTSVLQNINATVVTSVGVISNSSISIHPNAETTSTGMLKITYDKQPATRVAALQQEESVSSGRRSRYEKTFEQIYLFCGFIGKLSYLVYK